MKKPFKCLALGTKFMYPNSGKVWVKIDVHTVAEWSEANKTDGWLGQAICSFDDNDDTSKEVIVL